MKLNRCVCNIPIYDIKDIRVLWNSKLSDNKDRYSVAELIVAPFRYFGDDYKKEMDWDHTENTFENEHLVDRYTSSIGNCYGSWKQLDPNYLAQQLLLKVLYSNTYINDQVKEQAIFEFLQVKQMRENIVNFFGLCDNCKPIED